MVDDPNLSTIMKNTTWHLQQINVSVWVQELLPTVSSSSSNLLDYLKTLRLLLTPLPFPKRENGYCNSIESKDASYLLSIEGGPNSNEYSHPYTSWQAAQQSGMVEQGLGTVQTTLSHFRSVGCNCHSNCHPHGYNCDPHAYRFHTSL